MKSLKMVIGSIVFAILTALIASALFNFLFVRQTVNRVNNINNIVLDIKSTYVEMDMPIRVFNNILSQQLSNSKMDALRKAKLIDAYEKNRTLFAKEVNFLNEKSLDLSVLIGKLSKSTFILENEGFTKIKGHISKIQKYSEELSVLLNQSLKPSSDYHESDIKPIDKLYGLMDNNVSELITDYNIITRNLMDRYIMTISVIFMLLFLGVIILTFLLYKLLGKDMKYLLKSLNILHNHENDLKGLPEIKPMFTEEVKIVEYVKGILKERDFLYNVKSIAGRGYFIDETLEDLFNSIHTELKTDRVGVAFIDYNNNRIIAEHGISNYSENHLGAGFEVDFEHTTLTGMIKTRKPVISNDIEEELRKRPESKSLKLILKEGVKSNMIFPLEMDQTVFAFLFFSSLKKNNYDENSLRIGQNIALEFSALIDKNYLTKIIFSKITNTFSALVDRKDNETGGHISRMVKYSVIIAKALRSHPDDSYRVNNRFVRDIENNASIHDIGKVGIPDEILKKPGKLTGDEWIIMKTHSAIGGDIFLGLKEDLRIFNRDFYKIAENVARYHHERWDGTGYPEGLAGREIPLEARIIAIADVFDALTSKRVYKKAIDFDESVRIINQSAGSHLDPELVKVFNSQLAEIKSIYRISHENE